MNKIWKFKDNVNTDQIIPGRYYPREDVESLGNFCLCELHPKFSKEKKKGDVILGGSNFGCGSSREYAAIAIRYSGVKCIIAKSFGRIFYRNCINIGVPVLVCDEIYDDVEEGDNIEVNLENGEITVNGRLYSAQPLPEFVLRIANEGGIINFIKKNGIEALR